ncbi:hypothetical protein [Clostridium sp.]|uniref:hypothetical protein n=1 Tax=Clostridium sp. TaxID=1506 RepID=UPI002907B50C|nr:hypothetical protein [Clostridium sp.]MDU6542915.1 hypothetical protein [Clostridium sp.]
MRKITVRCPECKSNPTRLFDLGIDENEDVFIFIKCKKGEISTIKLNDYISQLKNCKIGA